MKIFRYFVCIYIQILRANIQILPVNIQILPVNIQILPVVIQTLLSNMHILSVNVQTLPDYIQIERLLATQMKCRKTNILLFQHKLFICCSGKQQG